MFKNLNGIITTNHSDKITFESIIFERLKWLTKNIYKGNLSVDAKLKDYNTVLKPVILRVKETSALNNLKPLKN